MQRPRTPSDLSESLHRRLNSYALAASAAGVGLLALVQPAEGKIVYTRTNVTIQPHQRYELRLNHDKNDFTLLNVSWFASSWRTCRTCEWRASILERPALGNAAMGYISTRKGWPVASALQSGAPIGAGGNFHPVQAKLMYAWSNSGCSGGGSGPWGSANGPRYLGLRFRIKGKTHYGWARLSLSGGYRMIIVTVTGYAYETVPNKPIIAGKTKGPDVITLEPASLGHLASGASAIPAWRGTN